MPVDKKSGYDLSTDTYWIAGLLCNRLESPSRPFNVGGSAVA